VVNESVAITITGLEQSSFQKCRPLIYISVPDVEESGQAEANAMTAAARNNQR